MSGASIRGVDATTTAHRAPRARRPLSQGAREALWGYFFVAPWIVGTLALTLVPMILSAYYSFTHYDAFSAPRWAGTANYVRVFSQHLFWTSLSTTLYYTLMKVPLAVGLSLGCALLLDSNVRGRSVFRGIFFFPSLVPSVACAYLWLWLFNPEFGLINVVARGIGLPGWNWLGSTATALPSIVTISLWATIGGTMMITFLAALQSVPKELYEAAEIDGAGRIQKFRKITLPMISPTIFFNIIIAIIGSFTVFDIVFVTTGGGPQHSTYTYFMHVFTTGFHSFDFGVASALTWILTLVLFALTALQFWLQKRWVHYQVEI